MTKCRHIAVDYFNLHSSGPKANGLNVAAIKYKKKKKTKTNKKKQHIKVAHIEVVLQITVYTSFLNNISILYTF